MKDISLIVSLCKDIARHTSQLEAECKREEQSTERYSELKNLLLSHYLHGEDNLETILNEIRKSIKNAGGWDNEEEITVSAKNHALCMLDYFLMLAVEEN
jgi:hypothetical protein